MTVRKPMTSPQPDRFARAVMLITVTCTLLLTSMVARREFFSSRQARKATSPRKVEPWPEIAQKGHFFGSPDVRNLVVVFSDFQCPYCRQFTLETFPALVRKYGSDIAVVFRHWPLPNHRWAYPAARAAECAAEQGKFRELHDYLFEHQEMLNGSFIDGARTVGLDVRIFEECFGKTGQVPIVERDIAVARQLKGGGTPLIVVNGLLLVAERDSSAIAHMIEKTTFNR